MLKQYFGRIAQRLEDEKWLYMWNKNEEYFSGCHSGHSIDL